MIMKMLEYPMVATTITESDWNKIMLPLTAVALPASGITWKDSFIVAYDPLQYQGLGIVHPFYWQEIGHITSIL
jgi:hypothetical protein